MQNADITLTGVRVPEANRLQGINRFRNTAQVLASTRGGVVWQALGVEGGAYELAREHATQREQFGKLIGGFQMIQHLLVKMLGDVTAMFGVVARLDELVAVAAARVITSRVMPAPGPASRLHRGVRALSGLGPTHSQSFGHQADEQHGRERQIEPRHAAAQPPRNQDEHVMDNRGS